MAAVPLLPGPLEAKLKVMAARGQHTSSDHGKTPASSSPSIWPSNKVTIASVLTNGECLTRVLDSSRDNLDQSWSKMETIQGNCDIGYRLVIAEDLPGATQRFFEPHLKDDLGMLVDHNAGSAKHEELYMNVSKSPETISIALPCKVRGDSRADPPLPWRSVIYPQWATLDTHWSIVSSASDPDTTFGETVHVTYRRVSYRMLPKHGQNPPLCKPEPTRRHLH